LSDGGAGNHRNQFLQVDDDSYEDRSGFLFFCLSQLRNFFDEVTVLVDDAKFVCFKFSEGLNERLQKLVSGKRWDYFV
jgi:hypothetical protein